MALGSGEQAPLRLNEKSHNITLQQSSRRPKSMYRFWHQSSSLCHFVLSERMLPRCLLFIQATFLMALLLPKLGIACLLPLGWTIRS